MLSFGRKPFLMVEGLLMSVAPLMVEGLLSGIGFISDTSEDCHIGAEQRLHQGYISEVT